MIYDLRIRSLPLFSFFIAFLVVAVDQLIKRSVIVSQRFYVINTGGIFGIFSNNEWMTDILIWGLILVAVFWLMRTKKTTFPDFLVLGLLLGGGVGNVIDRFFRGGVVDFFHINPFGYFNFSDIAITAAVAVGFWNMLSFRRKQSLRD